MARPKSIIPAYRLHKSTGQAVAYVDRQPVYLGKHGSPESREAFSRLLDRLRSGEAPKSAKVARKPSAGVFTLNDLLLRFATEELSRYSPAEQRCIRGVVKITRELFGETAAAEFGPLRLRTVREAMIRKAWSRSYINKQVKRLRTVLRWAVGWEMIPRTVVDALGDVRPLAPGDSEAPESNPRRAVPEETRAAVRAEFGPRHRDIFDLLLLTGARPGELLNLTTGAIDRTGEIWRADLVRHKTMHQGKTRTLFFNAKAQLILTKYLKADPSQRLFPLRGDTLSKAFRAACLKAGVPEFTPHWLRHTVATQLADDVGTEAAQRLLGHASKAMTEHYSKAAERVAIDAVKKLA